MNRLLRATVAVLSSSATSPVVICFFLLLYVGLGFSTDDTLTALIALTSGSVLLAGILALLPLNAALRLLTESARHLKRGDAMAGRAQGGVDRLFDEAVVLSSPSSFDGLERRIQAEGYTTRRSETALAAWKGVSGFPARALFLAGTFCLFAGILTSLTTRISHRANVIEGEQLPTAQGGGGIVERITLAPGTGAVLARNLTMSVAPSSSGDGGKTFVLYPPSLYRGFFVYPRYLGFAPFVRFSAPDLKSPYEGFLPLGIYPAGKEDSAEIPGAAYRIVFSVADPKNGTEPFTTGRITLLFKLLKDKEVVFTGSAPVGDTFVHNGYSLSILEARRMVITDFVRDYGVLLIWTATIIFIASFCVWVPIRLFLPRGEMLFLIRSGTLHSYSRAEGGKRKHAGVFHEALDLLEGKEPNVGGIA